MVCVQILNFETVGFAGDLDGLEPLYCVRTGHCDIKSLMQSFSIEEVGLNRECVCAERGEAFA